MTDKNNTEKKTTKGFEGKGCPLETPSAQSPRAPSVKETREIMKKIVEEICNAEEEEDDSGEDPLKPPYVKQPRGLEGWNPRSPNASNNKQAMFEKSAQSPNKNSKYMKLGHLSKYI